MAKKTAKAAKVAQEEQIGSIFEHFGTSDRSGERKPAADGQSSAQIEALTRRIDALTTDLSTANQRLSMQAAPAAQVDPRVAASADPSTMRVDLSGLPDPATEPDKYNLELAKRLNGVIEGRVYAVQQQVTSEAAQNRDAQQLWSNFSSQYPEWAAHEKLVGMVAVDVVNKAKAAGIDPNKYMFGNPTLFLADVAKELSTSYGALTKKDEEGEEGEEGGEGDDPQTWEQPAQHGQGLSDASRTEIFGGQESGGKPAVQQQTGQQSGLLADISAIQRKMGIV